MNIDIDGTLLGFKIFTIRLWVRILDPNRGLHSIAQNVFYNYGVAAYLHHLKPQAPKNLSKDYCFSHQPKTKP